MQSATPHLQGLSAIPTSTTRGTRPAVGLSGECVCARARAVCVPLSSSMTFSLPKHSLCYRHGSRSVIPQKWDFWGEAFVNMKPLCFVRDFKIWEISHFFNGKK